MHAIATLPLHPRLSPPANWKLENYSIAPSQLIQVHITVERLVVVVVICFGLYVFLFSGGDWKGGKTPSQCKDDF